MATVQKVLAPQKGSVGGVTYYQRMGKTVCRVKTPRRGRPTRTRANMSQQTKLANIVKSWSAFGGGLKDNFELKRSGQTDYNAFVSFNLPYARVFLTKSNSENNYCLADNFLISSGSMESIIEVEQKGNHYLSNIELGDFQIDNTTTVAKFSMAVLDNNPYFNDNDELLFYRTVNQSNMGEDSAKRFYTKNIKIVLDVRNNTLLLEELSHKRLTLSDFEVVDGRLACQKQSDSLIAWVQRRKTEKKGYLVTTQKLIGDNTLLTDYANDGARQDAIISYGQLKESYLADKEPAPILNPYEIDPEALQEKAMAQSPEPQPEPTQQNTENKDVASETQNQPKVKIICRAIPDEGGFVCEPMYVKIGQRVKVDAVANSSKNYRFLCWSDGVQIPEREIVARKNITYIAYFKKNQRRKFSSSCC